MALNGVMTLILRYFTELGSFQGALRKSDGKCRRKNRTFAISSPGEFLLAICNNNIDIGLIRSIVEVLPSSHW